MSEYISPAQLLKEGYSAGYDMQEGERKKALNRIFSQSIDTYGEFDTQSFLANAKEAGIGPDMVTAWLGQKTAKSDTATKEVTNAIVLERLGRKPDVLRDWFEQEKQKATGNRVSEKGAGAPIGQTTIDADKLPNPDALRTSENQPQSKTTQSGVVLSPAAPTTPKTAPTATTETPNVPYQAGFHRDGSVSEQLESMIKPKTEQPIEQGQSVDLGQGVVTGRAPNQETFIAPDPGYYTEQLPGTIPPEKKYDVVEESLRKREGYSLTNPMGLSQPGSEPSDSSIFNVDLKDDGTNEYRQYKTALDSKMQSMGFANASEWLKGVHDQTLKINAPQEPNPLAFTGNDGGAKEFGEQMMKYAQGQIQAKGKAEEAVMKAKESLAEFAKVYGVNTVEKNALMLDDTTQLRDKSYRVQARSLKDNLFAISKLQTQLKEAGTDKTKLAALVPTMAVVAATSRNPGQQPSEFSIEEVKQGLAGLNLGISEKDLQSAAGSVLTWFLGGMRGPNPVQQAVDKATFSNPDAFINRMKHALTEYKELSQKGLDKYTFKTTSTNETEDLKNQILDLQKQLEDMKNSYKTQEPQLPSAKEFAGASPKANPAAHKAKAKSNKTDSKGRPAL